MTNEELMRAYYYDPENSVEIMHQLLEQNMGLIYSIAEKVAAKFNCLEFEGNRKYTIYTKTIMDELVDEGILMLGDLIAGLKYDESKGMFTTYVYPHIEGHMRRWMEKNLGSVPLSKHMMKQVREIQRLHNQEGLDVATIAKQLNMPEAKVVQRLNYNTHSMSLDELLDSNSVALSNGTVLCRDNITHLNTVTDPVEWTVLMKIWLSLLPDVFEQLEERDKYILGHFFGVYDYEKKTLDELAFEEMLTMNGIYKAKEASLQRLRVIYRDSDLYIWRRAYLLTKKAAQQGC